MSVEPADYYNTGMSWEEFLASSLKNVDRMKAFYDEFDFDDDTAVFFNGRTPLQVLAIGEDWCPDVVQNVAMLAKIADGVPGMELSIVRRDENPELMAEYLTNGNKRIPVVAFFDMAFRELARWTGRCREADEWIGGEILEGTSWEKMSTEQLAAFNEEYDRRFRDSYARASLSEWQHLMEDEDF